MLPFAHSRFVSPSTLALLHPFLRFPLSLHIALRSQSDLSTNNHLSLVSHATSRSLRRPSTPSTLRASSRF